MGDGAENNVVENDGVESDGVVSHGVGNGVQNDVFVLVLLLNENKEMPSH